MICLSHIWRRIWEFLEPYSPFIHPLCLEPVTGFNPEGCIWLILGICLWILSSDSVQSWKFKNLLFPKEAWPHWDRLYNIKRKMFCKPLQSYTMQRWDCEDPRRQREKARPRGRQGVVPATWTNTLLTQPCQTPCGRWADTAVGPCGEWAIRDERFYVKVSRVKSGWLLLPGLTQFP